jgi:hypothetical protein
VADLIAGYALVRPGKAGYRGVLRRTPKSPPSWTCPHNDHLVPRSARLCAEAEREQRAQGEGQVFTLLHCKPCSEGGGSSWWDDAAGPVACPRCGVPLLRLKLAVVGSAPAVDEGNGKH